MEDWVVGVLVWQQQDLVEPFPTNVMFVQHILKEVNRVGQVLKEPVTEELTEGSELYVGLRKKMPLYQSSVYLEIRIWFSNHLVTNVTTDHITVIHLMI